MNNFVGPIQTDERFLFRAPRDDRTLIGARSRETQLVQAPALEDPVGSHVAYVAGMDGHTGHALDNYVRPDAVGDAHVVTHFGSEPNLFQGALQPVHPAHWIVQIMVN